MPGTPTEIGVNVLQHYNRKIGTFLQRFNRRAGTVAHRYGRFYLSLISLCCSGILFRYYIYNWAYGSGPSMMPTIPDQTNLLFINQRYRNGHGIQVGDCVQFSNPMFRGVHNGKRVVGMPGDYVLRTENYSATPGGAPLCGITDWRKRLEAERVMNSFGGDTARDEQSTDAADEEWAEPRMIQVPEGHVWVEGDNQGWSRDSRFYGPVPMALIVGRSSGYKLGVFSWQSLYPGKNLRKVEEWEMDDVLGEESTTSTGRAG